MDKPEKKPKQKKLQQQQQQKKQELRKKQRQKKQQKQDTNTLPADFLKKFPGYSYTQLHKAASFLYAFAHTYREPSHGPFSTQHQSEMRVRPEKPGVPVNAPSVKSADKFFEKEQIWARDKLRETYGILLKRERGTRLRMIAENESANENQPKALATLQKFLQALQADKMPTPHDLDDFMRDQKPKAQAPITYANVFVSRTSKTSGIRKTAKIYKLQHFFQEHEDVARAIGIAFDVTVAPGDDVSLVITSKGPRTAKMDKTHRQVTATMQGLAQHIVDDKDLTFKDVMAISYNATRGTAMALKVQKKLRQLNKDGLPPLPAKKVAKQQQTEQAETGKKTILFFQSLLVKKNKRTTAPAEKKEKAYKASPIKKKSGISAQTIRELQQENWHTIREQNRLAPPVKVKAKRNRSIEKKETPQAPAIHTAKHRRDETYQYHFEPVVVDGCAIDNADTEKCHSVFSVSKGAFAGQHRLDHAIIVPNFMCDAATDLPKDFFQNVKNGWQDRSLKRKGVRQYEAYFQKLMRDQACFEGFSEDVHKPALVHSFILNEKDNYAITDSFMTYGVAKKSWQFDYNVVNNVMRMKSPEKIDPETFIWFEAMRRQNISGTRAPGEKHNIESAMEKMVKLSQQLAAETARTRDIELIHQVPGDKLTEEFKNNKNRNSFVCTSKLVDQNIPSHFWHTPITKDDMDVSLLNRGLMHYYFASNGRNLLERHVVGAIAMAYQTNFNSGKELTPLEAKLIVANNDDSAFHLRTA